MTSGPVSRGLLPDEYELLGLDDRIQKESVTYAAGELTGALYIAGGTVAVGIGAVKGPGRGNPSANIQKPSRADFHITVRKKGYDFHAMTKDGYIQYRNTDGSRIWVRPDGEVIRLGPKVTPTEGGKRYRPRIDTTGNRIGTHNPGEFISPLPVEVGIKP